MKRRDLQSIGETVLLAALLVFLLLAVIHPDPSNASSPLPPPPTGLAEPPLGPKPGVPTISRNGPGACRCRIIRNRLK